MKKWFLAIGLIFGILLTGCAGTTKESSTLNHQEGPIKVTVTIGMITDIVNQVGKEHVKTTGLMKTGVDPHLYKASQGDIKKLAEADIIFYNGLHLEGKMQEILEKMAETKPTVAVTDGIDKTLLKSGEVMETQYDPHVWFNVKYWMKAVEKVRDELSAIDPDHQADYQFNAAEYLKKLEELDTYVKNQVAAIPEESRVLVTAHDAFGYFGEAYDIEVRGLQGLSTASEYGSRDVTELRDYLVSKKIKAVFVESSVPKKAIESVVEGAKHKGHDIQIGGELFSDAMGPEGTEEGTYVGMVRHNVDTIVRALK